MSGSRSQWSKLLAFAASGAVACTFGCKSPPDPQTTFDHARQMFVRGDLPSARSEAHSGFQRFSGRNQEWAWKFRLLEAEVLVNQGKSKDALALLDAALPPQLAHTDLSVKQTLLQGAADIPLGRLADADQRLNSAQELCDALRSPLAGEIARARGVLEARQNHLDEADRSYHKSLQIAQQQGDGHLEMNDLLNLGTVALRKEHYDESIDWSSAANRKAQVLEDRHTAEVALGNLGYDYYKMGDFERSLALYQEAEKKAIELGAMYEQILWLNNLGLVYYQMNQLATAEDYYRKALALAQKSETPQLIIDALTDLAFVSAQKGQLTEAEQFGQQAFQLAHARNDRPSELYPLLVEGQISAARGEEKQAEKVFREIAHDSDSDLSLRWEAQNDLAALYEHQHQFPAADKQYREALSTIERARASLRREDFKLPFQANAAHLYDDYIHFLVSQEKNQQALEIADYSRAQTLAEGLGILRRNPQLASALDAQKIARQANATILFYWLGQQHSYLWAVTPHSTTLYPLPPAAEIDAAVQRYRRALLGWQDVLQTQNQDGAYLYRVLVEPARKLIARNARVILIPDGSLDSLNFETLLVPDPQTHYWIEDVTELSASSLRVLAASHAHPETGTGKMFLIGDAIAVSPEYGALPNAGPEMKNVAKHFGEAVRQIDAHQQATPAAYLASDPEQFSFIHFVAHATASKLSPLDSAIVLSPSSPEPDSFKLYARDITNHPLRAKLVTISSCYGAGTTAYSGEGLVGLSWAFLRAGAHNVVGALWEVNDASTARLMDQLYEELQRGQAPDAALRSAKLSLLHSDDVVRKPFYWAPFQLYTGR